MEYHQRAEVTGRASCKPKSTLVQVGSKGKKGEKTAQEENSVHKSCSVACESGVSQSQSLWPSPYTVQA